MTESPPPVIERLERPPSCIHLAASDKDFFPGLLESQSGEGMNARYDILFAAPLQTRVAYNADQLNDLLTVIDQQPSSKPSKLPFEHGWLVYFSYEAVNCWQPKLSLPPQQVLAAAILCAGAVVIDRVTQTAFISGQSQQVVDAIKNRIKRLKTGVLVHNTYYLKQLESAQLFHQGIETCQQYIRRGDIYQANLSRQWLYHSQDSNPSAAGLFARLKKTNPAPFAALFQYREWAIVSSSPERLFNVNNGCVSTRPIAGTHPRGHNSKADRLQIKRLISDDKEQAEHIMLVDLERNDIGRVCEPGSVQVNELMVVETYPHVHHIVSNVQGRLRTDVGLSAVIKALFPGGTITGCPKIRCMQIIAEIEQRPRGAYTGSIGYINHQGQSDFNILIRTLSLQGTMVQFNAGAGIVHDSDAHRETEETEHKAQGMIRALNG
ncbi:MAG: chorismate-binding protein [Marinicella pacifica]